MIAHKSKLRFYITLFGPGGEATRRQDLSDFELPEAIVLSLSVRYFNDPAPCEIHRAAVHNSAMLDLAAFCRGKAAVPLEALSAEQRAFFPEGTRAIRIEEQTL